MSLGLYDYGARFYDPQIGRFHTQDAFAEKYYTLSPYQYGADNPILNIDVNGDSINVASIQKYDQKNSTNFLDKITSDLSAQTGLNYTVSSSGQLLYQKDKDGNAIISATKGKDGNTIEVGSQEARSIMADAIGNNNTSYAQITTGRSNAIVGGNLIKLNPDQINGFINGSNNVDNRTLGWGMTFMHEISHSIVGGGLSDHLPAGSATGQVVDRLNIVRQQLNHQGGNYGQRMMYKGTYFTPTGSPSYLPFDYDSNSSIMLGIPPPLCGKNIKF